MCLTQHQAARAMKTVDAGLALMGSRTGRAASQVAVETESEGCGG
jgi:hypothetical protein